MGELVPVAKRYADTKDFMMKSMPALQAALPKFISPDRMLQVCLTTLRNNPKLLACKRESTMGCIMTCAQLGLMPDGVTGRAYLIPFKDECTLIIGYKGLMDLARRSGEISTIQVVAVHEKDKFGYTLGLEPSLDHKPYEGGDDPGSLTYCYAVCRLKDGGTQFEVMSRAQIDGIRKQSRAGNSGPWVTHYEEMAKKTVLRRLCKMLPMSTDLQTAVAMDEAADAGLKQYHPACDAEFTVSEPEPEVEVEADAELETTEAGARG